MRSWLSATCSAGDCVSVLVAMLIVSPCDAERGSGGRHSSVVKQLGDVAIGVGDGGHQAAATGVVRGLLHGAVCAGHGCGHRTAQRSSWSPELSPQLTALFTSAPILASSAALNSLSAKEVGHMAPSSRFTSSLKPSVAYLELN